MPFDAIYGQPEPIAILNAIAKSHEIGSGYLFEGPNGVGKKLCAIAFAQALLCDEKPDAGCGICTTCTRIASSSHPDVRLIGPREDGNNSLQVEFIREDLLRYVQFAPFEARHACVIITDADICFPSEHPESANALLKALEEPRSHVHFILLTERPDRLLITIRSRCQRIRFHPLSDETIETILRAHDIAPEPTKLAIALAGGSAHRALGLASDEGLSALQMAQDLDAAITAKKQGMLIKFSEDLAKSEALPTVIDILLVMYRDRIAGTLGMPAQKTMLNSAQASQRKVENIAALAESAYRIQQARNQLESQANTQIVLDHLFLSLSELV